MNWFREHLHLTYIGVFFLLGLVFAVILVVIPNEPPWAAYAYTITGDVVLVVGAVWVLKEKKRSWWWLLTICFIPPIVLFLNNRSKEIQE